MLRDYVKFWLGFYLVFWGRSLKFFFLVLWEIYFWDSGKRGVCIRVLVMVKCVFILKIIVFFREVNLNLSF